MKNRNTVSIRTNASDSYEVYTANITPENHNLHTNKQIPIPTIRLTQATPSDNSIPSIIAPKSSPRKKIVPKKSKLTLLSTKAGFPSREKDFSDILRRVNASTTNLDGNATCNVTVNGGTTMKVKDLLKFKDRSSRSTIDIYVDPADDPDIGEIVVVKKKKSRAKLDGLFDDKENAEVKGEPREESKWWSIRGRKKERLRNNSLNALKINVTEANTVFAEARQRCGSTPLSPPDSGYSDSIALRAMKSIARIGSWAQLKNNNLPRDIHQGPPGSHVKSSISSFEVGALSTHTGEDLTNRLSPMASLGHGPPPGPYRFLNPSITNTSVRPRTSSCGTVLSVVSPTDYLQPNDNRRLSTSSSSGESNRPGSTYTASGEDNGAWEIPVKTTIAKSKKGMRVKWGSVSSALALTKGKNKLEKEKLPEKEKKKDKENTSKNGKEFVKTEKVTHLNQAGKTNGPSKDKEDQSKGLKCSHGHRVEGRRRTHVMSVFPGLSFGRSTDLNVTSNKTSMPPIAEDPNRLCEPGSPPRNTRKLNDQQEAFTIEEAPIVGDNCTNELSDSESDTWNRNNISDEEACIRFTTNNFREESLQVTASVNCDAIPNSDLLPARPRPRPRPASEQLLSSGRTTQRSRPVGMVLDIDVDGNGYGDKEGALALSVLEAANSDLASLINRLDLEATPDKDHDTTATYAEAIAAWRASGPAIPRSLACTLPIGSQTVPQSLGQVLANGVDTSPSDLRCSVFRGDLSQKAQDIKLAYRDPIAFLDPTVDSSTDPLGSAVGESFAFINSVNGTLPEDSPLRRIGKIRAMTRAMNAASEAAGATMSRRFSAISASTRASVTSLRPYAFATVKSKDGDARVATAALEPTSKTVAIPAPTLKQRMRRDAAIEQTIVPGSESSEHFGDSSHPSIHNTDVHSALSTQGSKCSSKGVTFNRTSRTSSIASTFGTGAVLASIHKPQTTASAPVSESGQTENPPSRTSGAEQKSLTYALPLFELAEGSPVSLYASQFGIEDTPTRPSRDRGHIRQSSGLVPLSQRPTLRGNGVRRKIEYIEQLTRFEHEKEEQERKEISRRGAVKDTARISRSSTASHWSHASSSPYSPSLGKDVMCLPVPMPESGAPMRTEREDTRSRNTFSDDEQPDSDIPDELKKALSANNQFLDGSSPDTPFLFVASTSGNMLPPSPGLPPTSPLPIPVSESLILPTPTSTNGLGIEIEPSPPAPSLLPVIDPSPSPESSRPSLLLPTFMVVPPQRQQLPSEDGDIDESAPRVISRGGLSISGSGSDDDTKQSFDFTGELKRLNESGGSHRRSFVEQLDAAFKTPAHLTVRDDLGIKAKAMEESNSATIPTLEAGLDIEMEEGLSMMVESLNESMNNLGLETSRSVGTLASPPVFREVMSKPSYGLLDTAFKFGGQAHVPAQCKELPGDNSVALELPGVAALSTSPSSLNSQNELPRRPSVSIPAFPVEEDSSVLHSIYVHAAANDITQLMDMPAPKLFDDGETRQVLPRSSDLESDTSSKRRIHVETARAEKAKLPTHIRQSSDVSFVGFSSFGAVRTKFEFGPDRPDFYSSMQVSETSMSKCHLRHESLFSLASVSSYGEVIKPGMNDPFNYGSLVVTGDEEARDKFPGLDGFDDHKRKKRFSTDSDVSSFYFRPSDGRSHTRNQSVVSTNSINGPPISLYNRTFNHGHRRNDSGGSMSSVAAAYSKQGANGGRAAWMRHQREQSTDSVISEFSGMRLGRPGVGDKMFESIADHFPLTSISASPPESVGNLARKSSYDSILDDERRSTVDSIFDNTGHRSSISSDSVFWHDPTNDERQQQDIIRRNLFPPTHLFRPLSLSSTGNHETSREDDTMITMLGGEHVRRRSLGSSFEASPCLRVEKQKREFPHDHVKIHAHDDGTDDDEEGSPIHSTSPTAKIGGRSISLVHKASVASARSNKFGETRMNLARNGLLHRESLEDSCLSADGEEDLSMISIRSKGFSRPAPRRQRKPVVTITQPPDTTPPLSSSDGSGESQSSIDIERLKVLLQTAAAGSKSSASRIRSGTRIRAPGQGHRRRASQVSRGSMIGTIQEEVAGVNGSPQPAFSLDAYNSRNKRNSSEGNNSSYSSEALPAPLDFESVENSDKSAVFEPHIVGHQQWDEERWVIGLRKYYALRSEADEEISHSRIMWPDTPFSLHALHTFVPPREPAVMQALLEHSQKNYESLPTDRHPRRIRSRASSTSRSAPYSRPTSSGGSSTRSKKNHKRSRSKSSIDTSSNSASSQVLQPKSVNSNMPSLPMLAAITPLSPFSIDLVHKKNNSSAEESFLTFAAIENLAKEQTMPLNIMKPDVRPRVPSATRRTALGWSKRRTTKDEEGKNNKENEAHGVLVSPSESLRIVRPRPRSRVIAKQVNVAPRSTPLLST